ncbi:hypothetical protein LH464_04350 [Neorhizobium sp. T786]|uniref:hypothetical protein n=1 Tax=Pseudorhizobium xiangyangii TaxID=2883104 RepID=UPI001CFFDBE7|nr:hypothetical protein [Neorhizobium xiangyangii]MCB5201709.1 hypothetical protein [Neorhizobium xiangyangii]
MGDAVFDDGSLDEEKARVLWFANTNPSYMRSRRGDGETTGKRGKKSGNTDMARGEFLIKTETAEVNLAIRRIELAVLEGSLVSLDEVRRAQRAAGRATRDMFLNFAPRHGAEMAGELGVDPGTFIGLLEAHIRKALNEAADQPMPEDGDE